MTAADDVNLDDLKRRARRRLVGAIVLALVVAVAVPMLLESDPKPLGEDVAVKIPPVDDGKFVNRLADKGKTDAAKAPASKAEVRNEPKVETARPEPKAEPPKAEPEPAARTDAPAEAPKVETAKVDVAKSEPSKADAAASSSTAAKSVAPVTITAAPGGDFAVQVYAFSDAYGANSLVGKLKRAGYPAYSEQASTSKGTLWRVRIGPFASRESASSARDKLKGEGYNGIVAAAK